MDRQYSIDLESTVKTMECCWSNLQPLNLPEVLVVGLQMDLKRLDLDPWRTGLHPCQTFYIMIRNELVLFC